MMLLETIGIHGWGHMVQIIVILGLLVWCSSVLAGCVRELKVTWQEIKREASLSAAEEAHEKTHITSSIALSAGSVKEGE